MAEGMRLQEAEAPSQTTACEAAELPFDHVNLEALTTSIEEMGVAEQLKWLRVWLESDSFNC